MAKSKNSEIWYSSASFKALGHEWNFTYHLGARRTIESKDAQLVLNISATDSNRYPSPQAWLERWAKSKAGKQWIEKHSPKQETKAEQLDFLRGNSESKNQTESTDFLRGNSELNQNGDRHLKEEDVCLNTVTYSPESEGLPSQAEPLPQDKQRSPSVESCISIPLFSKCPYCQQELLKSSDGCGVCGWIGEEIFLGEKSTVSNIKNRTNELDLVEEISPKKNPKGISFGKTLEQLFKGKCCTRRIWSDRHAKIFIKYFEQGVKVPAYDKDPRFKGQIIGRLTLTQKPYQDKLSNMTSSDLIAEGFPDYRVEQFIDEFFEGKDQVIWVIWFNFEPFLGEMPCTLNDVSKVSPKKNEKAVERSPSTEISPKKNETEKPSLVPNISPKKNPSGSLYQFLQDKKNKDGVIKTYPKIIGENRDPNNPDHWLWAYCYDEKDDKGKWRTRKRSVAREKLDDIKRAIKQNKTVEEILKLI